MKIHAGEKNYQCDKCESRYINSAALRNHILAKHTEGADAVQFICSYCGKGFKKKDYLIKHVTGHTGEKKYKCSVCAKCFRFETTLASHMDMHNGILWQVTWICTMEFESFNALIVIKDLLKGNT